MKQKLEITVVRESPAKHATPLLAVQVIEGETELTGIAAKLDQGLRDQIGRLLSAGDFKGKDGQVQILYPGTPVSGPQRVLLVGLGAREKLDLERLRRAAGAVVKQALRLGLDRASCLPRYGEPGLDAITAESAGCAAAEGFELASYTFDDFKAKGSDGDEASGALSRMEILAPSADGAKGLESGVSVGSAMAYGENLARQLGNLPGNVATPTYLAEVAREIAGRSGMSATILGPAEIEAEGLGALLAVSRGSEQEPRLIVLEHRKGPADAQPLVLVGKGLTFDSGGISIKPAASMEEMKFDMCGGAAVLGAMQAIGELDPPINVIGIVPSTENLISGRALKPGDIIRTHLGKTIEVLNTDAEGRLILADALSYAQRFEPAAIVDAATLTGACVIALGHHASAVMGNDDGLIEELRSAGKRVGERAWPLPLYDEYRDQIKSDYADIKNTGGRPAGAITAAWFLREFVGDIPWAHLDIAGTSHGDGKLSYQIKGASGVPTRLLTEWVLSRAG